MRDGVPCVQAKALRRQTNDRRGGTHANGQFPSALDGMFGAGWRFSMMCLALLRLYHVFWRRKTLVQRKIPRQIRLTFA